MAQIRAMEPVTLKRVIHTETQKKEAKEKLAKQHEEDSKVVKGIFKNLECKGGTAQFPWRKYPQDEIEMCRFEDGKAYEIPLGLAKHINNDCFIPRHDYLVDENGDRIVGVAEKNHRYQFLSTEFM